MGTREKFNNAVAKMAMVSVEEVKGMELVDVCKKIILPKIALIGGSQSRYSRLSDNYMELMAEYGHFLYHNTKNEVVSVLFELGLQRMSKGALLHAPVDLLKTLPDAYKMYTTAYDEPGLFSEGCWEFLKTNLPLVFNNIDGNVKRHARTIVFGIMEHISEKGETDMLWLDEVVKPMEVRKLVEPYATTMCSENERWDYVMRAKTEVAYRWVKKCNAGIVPYYNLTKALAPKWMQNKAFFKDAFNVMDWRLFEENVDFDKEKFYTGKTRKFLEFFGLYKMLTLKKIKAEIKAYELR